MLLMTLLTEPIPMDEALAIEELLFDIADGKSEAFETLYHRTRTAVYGFALSICRNVHDAEDVTQQTYLRVLDAADRYRPQGKPMAWLLTIVKRLSISRLREQERQSPTRETDWEAVLTAHERLTAEDRITIRDLIKQLSERERQIVLLRAAGGLKHREIAELLELPLSTVLSSYQRSIQKLRTLWKETD